MGPYTYPEVGATRQDSLPPGYRHLRHRARIGDAAVVRDAAEAVLSFAPQRAAGVLIEAAGPRAAEGLVVTSRLGAGPLRIPAPCRVVWTEDTPTRAGFGYGTLPGHPVRGEEAFLVEVTEDAVWFTMRAFSRPDRWFTTAAGPLVPAFQHTYARLLTHTLRKLVARR